MSELNLRDARRAAQEFCAANLRECCAELNEWQTKSTLRDGKLRELGVLCERYVGEHDGLKNAEAMVEFQACAIVATAPASTPQQPAQRASIDTPELRELLQEYWSSMGSRTASKVVDKIITHLEALVSAGSTTGAVPAGWKLVPVEPTPEMIAAMQFKGDIEIAIGHGLFYKEAAEDYAAMLAAAPSNQSPAKEA